jgi:formylglycine-generating enzyme required for sulfatase activity
MFFFMIMDGWVLTFSTAVWMTPYALLNYHKQPEDTKIDKSGDGRVLRGGSWFYNANSARAAARYDLYPGTRYDYYGFRVVVVRPPSQ